MSEEKFVVCPYCQKSMKSLMMHVVCKHDVSWDEFKKTFPDVDYQVGVKPKNRSKCPYCDNNKMYAKSGLWAHIFHNHKDIWDKKESNKVQKTGLECPICHKIVKIISQHVKTVHQLEWDDFIKQFNWTQGKTCLFGEEHRLNLSKNKKFFYSTPEGENLRQLQSEMHSGSKNPVHLPGVREKISLSATDRIIDPNKENAVDKFSHGIRVEYKNFKFRSLEEFKIALSFMESGIPFEFETEYIMYFDEQNHIHHYIVDFIVNDLFIEVKHDADKTNYLLNIKYKTAKEKFGDKFQIFNFQMVKKWFNIENRYHIPYFFIKKCKELLKHEDIYFKKYSRIKNYSFLEKLDKNYRNNKKIICS